MKRKIACLLMALMLVVSLLPMGAVRSSAASYLYPSENLVSLLKQFEGFSASAYWDSTQYTIGYGTTGYAGQTITEAAADTALRDRLNTLNTSLNSFTASHNLYLNQYQHDALLSLSYNCGTSWMNDGGRLYQAVCTGATGNDFLFAICLWANKNSTPDTTLLNRRLAEANLYLNGIYSKSAPSTYTYTIFDPNGGTAGTNGEDKMQGYIYGSTVAIKVSDPTLSGYAFGGWFTAASGGSGVTSLSTATAARTLYAQYGTAGTVTANPATVYSGAGIGYTTAGTVSCGSTIVLVETAVVNGVTWGRCIYGWVKLSDTSILGGVVSTGPSSSSSSTTYATGIVTASSGVNVRTGPGTSYSTNGSRYNGATVAIYATTTGTDGLTWGRIGDNQWICMSYVTITSGSASSSTSTGITTSGTTISWEGTNATSTSTGSINSTSGSVGTVTASGVNVRSGPGMGYSVVGSLTKGTQVTVYAQTTVNSVTWGQIDTSKWVCMNYISLSSSSSSSSTGTIIATGVVNNNINLNVRSGPGTGYSKVSSLTPGTTVNIYERTTVNGAEWGRIADGWWVCLSYVTLTSSSGSSSGSGSSSTTTVTTTGTVTATTLNVRSGAGTGYSKISTLTQGATVTIYETTYVNGTPWGRIGTNAWICLNYVSTTGSSSSGSSSSGSSTTGTTITGTVTASMLNVRSAAGTGSVIGYLYKGSTVTIYETTYVNGVAWGRVASGWVSMAYISVTGTGTASSSSTGTVIWS